MLTYIPTASHKYQELPLIPVEEFLAQHPEHADDGENALMIARIDHERAEREALEQQRQELLKRKAKLISDNKRRRDDLANLDKDLEKFIDVSFCRVPFPCNRNTDLMSRPRNRSRSSSRKWCSMRLRSGLLPVLASVQSLAERGDSGCGRVTGQTSRFYTLASLQAG